MANGVNLGKLRREVKREEEVIPSQDLIDAWCKSTNGGSLQLCLLDDFYYAPPWKTWEKIYQHSGLKKRAYKAEKFDCDKFAYVLSAKAFDDLEVNICRPVIDASGGHAYNCVFYLKSDGKIGLHFFEPQNGRKIRTGHGQYLAKEGIVI